MHIKLRILARLALLALAVSPAPGRAQNLKIESTNGPVTPGEIEAFKTFVAAQTPPEVPWANRHNAWSFGPGGRTLEALGMMYEVTSDVAVLNEMIRWADACVSQRNDLLSVDKGGQRELWTGRVDKVWCPEPPTARNALYAGCETEDAVAHMAYCAKLILHHRELWATPVPDGDPHEFGATYLQRAKTYVARCDEANDDYFLKWFVQKDTNLIRSPEDQPAWAKINNNVDAINRQMMFVGGYQRLAECHELLGDAPERIQHYDAIAKASLAECLAGIRTFAPSEVDGRTVYNWHYFPWSKDTSKSESVGHAAYDILGICRAAKRPAYAVPKADLEALANTLLRVIAKSDHEFAATVDGKGRPSNYLLGEWILLADWNSAVYNLVANAAIASRRYENNANLTAYVLWMKHRRATGAAAAAPVPAPATAALKFALQLASAAAAPRRPKLPEGVELLHDVEIGIGGRKPLHVDIFRAKQPAAKPTPAVLWIHGGAWNSGSHHETHQYQRLATAGYFVASVEYRLTQEGPFPTCLEDCKLAVRWLRANAAKYNVDTDHIGVWGASAGGHLVSLLGLTADDPQFEGKGGFPGVSTRVQAVIDFCGPSDYSQGASGGAASARTESPVIAALAGGSFQDKPELWTRVSPITYATPDDAPHLLVYGDNDDLVPLWHGERLDAALKKSNVEHELIVVKHGRHGYTLHSNPGDPEPADPDPEAVYQRVVEFLDRHLKQPSTAAPH